MDKDYKKELIKLVEKTEINKGYHDYFKNKDLVNNYSLINPLPYFALSSPPCASISNFPISK